MFHTMAVAAPIVAGVVIGMSPTYLYLYLKDRRL